MTPSAIPDLPDLTKGDQIVLKLFGVEEAVAIRRLADEMTLRHNEHHPVIRYAIAETAVLGIISYEPADHMELMHAARLVSLSMLQTDLAHEVAQPTTTIEQKVRLASAVMGLERTICQSEKHFTQRQAALRAAQPTRPPGAPAATRTGDQARSSPVTGHPSAAPPRMADAAAAVATPAASAAVAAAAPCRIAPAPVAPSAARPAAAAASAAPVSAAQSGASAAAPDPAEPALASAGEYAVGSATRPASAAAPAASAALASAAEWPAAPAPHQRPSGASRPAAAAHPATQPPAPGGPYAAVLDLDNPPDGASAAVRDQLIQAMAHRIAAEGAARPPPGFGQAARS